MLHRLTKIYEGPLVTRVTSGLLFIPVDIDGDIVEVSIESLHSLGTAVYTARLNGVVLWTGGDRISIAAGSGGIGTKTGLEIAVEENDDLHIDLVERPAGNVPSPVVVTVVIDDGVDLATSAIKDPPVDGDHFLMFDSADSAAPKRTLWSVIKSTLKTYFDTLYSTKEIVQNSQSAAYELILADSGKHILHPTADDNAREFTIPANAGVAFPVGTAITIVNQINTVTIAITTDTLTLAGAGTTGSRTLAANGIATAVKIDTTSWIISGTGLT